MTTLVDAMGAPLRALALELAPQLASVGERLRMQQAPRVSGLGYQLAADDVGQRAAWWLLGQWLCGFALGALDADATLRDGEQWFANGRTEDHLAPPGVHVNIVASQDQAWALMPYLLDPVGQGTRRQVLASDAHRPDRERRKRSGVYYTPADVARYMARAVDAERAATALDPACGSAVFLRAALIENRECEVFGVDIDPLAVEMAAFVLLATTGASGCSPLAVWHRHRLRFAVLDALTLRDATLFDEPFRRARVEELAAIGGELAADVVPEPADDGPAYTKLALLFPTLHDGADAILSNPPYAPLGPRHDFGDLAANFDSYADAPPTTASNLYLPFVELGWKFASDKGRAAFVVPLSIAYGRGRHFKSLRSAMARSANAWSFAFFDRTPDAVFGDDVKTRAAIAVRRARGEHRGVHVTGLLRWTSRTRRELWESITPVRVARDIGPFIPKLATAEESSLYSALRALTGTLAADVTAFTATAVSPTLCTEFDDTTVFVAPTAYNWLSCAREAGAFLRHGHDSESPVSALGFETAEVADAAYAVLACRLTFWLWRVEGDAFHVPRSFLLGLPMSLSRLRAPRLHDLASAGRRLWCAVSTRPVLAVNKSRQTVGFASPCAPVELRAVDAAVAAAFGLEDEVQAAALDDWYRRLVVVDETDKRRTSQHKEPTTTC